MNPPGPLDRSVVLALLATYHRGPRADGDESIDSLELAWLIHQVEQRYAVTLDLDDDQLERMTAVDPAVEVLQAAVGQHVPG